MKRKLSISFLAVIILLWLICGYTILSRIGMQKTFNDLKDNITPNTFMMTEIRYAVTDIKMWTLIYIIRGNVVRNDKILREWLQGQWINLEKCVNEHLQSDCTIRLESPQSVKKIADLSQRLSSLSSEIIDLKDQGIGKDELFEKVRTEFDPVFYSLREMIDKYTAVHIKEVSIAMDRFHKIFNANTGYVILLSLIATFVSLFIGLLVHNLFMKYIAGHKQVERVLREGEEKYRRLFEQSNDAIFIHTFKGKILDVNKRACEMLDCNKDRLLELSVLSIYPEEELPVYKKAFQSIRVKSSVRFESRFKRADGSIIDVEISARFIDKEKGVIQGIVRDITERKKIEEQLRLFSQGVKCSVDGLTISDLEGRITYVNESLVRMFGYSRDELIGKRISFIYSENQMPKLEKAFKTTMQYSWIGDLVGKKKSGELFPIMISSSRILDNKGNLIAHMAIHRDITEREQIQKQLIRSEKLSAVGQLAAGVAHEFNNILAVIRGNVQLFLSELEDNRGSIETLKIIDAQTKKGANIVANMIAFAESKPLKREICDVSEVIEDVLKLREKFLKLENIIVEKNYLHKEKVNIDKGQMQQVFFNLINNARDAIKPIGKGTICISVSRVKNRVEICICDSGIGMDDETKNNIFNPFFTTKGAMAEDNLGIQGAGLGLSVAYTLIKNHNGTINVESEKGKGSTFIVTLPIVIAEGEGETIKYKELHLKKSETAKELHILVVDDEEEITDLLNKVFKKLGYKNVIAVNSGKDALSVFEKQPFDLVFLDMLLPERNGEQILNDMKKIDSNVPVIFISGKLGLEVEKMKEKGAYSFIQKPFDIKEIAEILNKITGEKTGIGYGFS